MKKSNKNDIHMSRLISGINYLVDNDERIVYGGIIRKKKGLNHWRQRIVEHTFGVNKEIDEANSHLITVDSRADAARGYDHFEF
jgi:hypothetical protein